MSHDSSPADAIPHAPRWPASVSTEGFGSRGEGRDIFFAAVASTRMPMVVADPRLPDVPIVFVNNAFLQMTGYSEAEVVGRNCRFLQGPDTDKAVVQRIREAVQSRREVTVELLNYRKDGTSFWNALFLTPVHNATGELIYYFSSQLDITRRHDAEAALSQAQKMEALGQLTGGIAHDFNNLLQVILGNVDLARLLTREVHNEKLSRTLSNIKEAALKSGTLTQQLLAFARKQQLQGRVVQLNDHASKLPGLAQQSFGADVAFEWDLAPDLWNTRIDPRQADLALSNLLQNACEAMPGGGTVTLATANVDANDEAAAQHRLPRAGRFVVISMSDTGKGIEPDVLPRVMDPFFSSKPPSEGTGLGLSMVYGFAKQSGGTATIESEPGIGTTVRLFFPATDELARGTAQVVAQDDDATRGRVLIVDDRPEIAELAGLILAQDGYECVEAVSAKQALDTMQAAAPFQLLLTDLIMPGGMNGVLLAREAQRLHPPLRVLLMTGFADGTPERWSGEHYEILHKPFSADDLQRKVRQLLS